ncbi:photosynthetic complex putative assembly protein PuhB [Aurantiacibacter zhengii]|uniref:PH domain-containing protein n=1 Tax=Aurantiacibacter zhengii TaxID=2307003 RepID=A0A418NRR4_9SPHN|nr:photosynthetic complex putative assembly protein PuhB [Aurantiacibacter zhengii]RIV85615.1 PH domain-containing protein [Aurantiacibacter zhengii]
MAVTEYENEPIRGLPGYLPEGEHIVWQGVPDWRVFARSALYTRWIGFYFTLLTVLALVSGSLGGALLTAISGVLALGLLNLFAWGVGKTTVYTITNRRLVLRIGVALNKCINLPLATVGSASLRAHAAGHGDIALQLTGKHRLGYAVLWPHVRPLRLRDAEPMLRALPDAENVAAILRRTCSGVVPNARIDTDTAPAANIAPPRKAAA